MEKNVRDSSGQPVTVHGLIWVIGCAIKSCLDWNEAGNGRETRVHKMNL